MDGMKERLTENERVINTQMERERERLMKEDVQDRHLDSGFFFGFFFFFFFRFSFFFFFFGFVVVVCLFLLFA